LLPILRKFKPFLNRFLATMIDVKPTGSVEMDLVALQNKIIRPFRQETDPIYRLILIKG
jgi:hypothetical protein